MKNSFPIVADAKNSLVICEDIIIENFVENGNIVPKMEKISFANSIDPDGAAHNELPHLDPHCLPELPCLDLCCLPASF